MWQAIFEQLISMLAIVQFYLPRWRRSLALCHSILTDKDEGVTAISALCSSQNGTHMWTLKAKAPWNALIETQISWHWWVYLWSQNWWSELVLQK